MDGSPLIGVEDLAHALFASTGESGEGQPVVLDARWRLTGPPSIDDYRQGHLPGAVFVDLDRDLSGPPGTGGRHPLPETVDFQTVMRRCGVFNDRPVVVYDHGNPVAAARAWWLLRYFGHQRVRVLDGGYHGWVQAAKPVTGGVPEPPYGDFDARPGGMPVLEAGDVPDVARAGVLLDVRAPERYRGETEPMDPIAGHIPGAVNAPAAANTDADGYFLDPLALRAQFDSAGVRSDTRVGTYCGSGVTAAHQVLALQLAGIPAELYAGSWSQWVADPSRPIATGPESRGELGRTR